MSPGQRIDKEKEEKHNYSNARLCEKAKDDYVLHDRICPQCGKLHTDITALKKHMNAWKGLDCVETRCGEKILCFPAQSVNSKP